MEENFQLPDNLPESVRAALTNLQELSQSWRAQFQPSSTDTTATEDTDSSFVPSEFASIFSEQAETGINQVIANLQNDSLINPDTSDSNDSPFSFQFVSNQDTGDSTDGSIGQLNAFLEGQSTPVFSIGIGNPFSSFNTGASGDSTTSSGAPDFSSFLSETGLSANLPDFLANIPNLQSFLST